MRQTQGTWRTTALGRFCSKMHCYGVSMPSGAEHTPNSLYCWCDFAHKGASSRKLQAAFLAKKGVVPEGLTTSEGGKPQFNIITLASVRPPDLPEVRGPFPSSKATSLLPKRWLLWFGDSTSAFLAGKGGIFCSPCRALLQKPGGPVTLRTLRTPPSTGWKDHQEAVLC